MQIPRWFFFLSGVVLIVSGVVRIVLNPPPKKRRLGPKPVETEAPVSGFPWQVGLIWSSVYVAAGVAVILYAAGVIDPRR